MRKIRNIRYEDGLLIGDVDVIYLLGYKLVIKVLEQLEQSKKNRNQPNCDAPLYSRTTMNKQQNAND